MWLRYVDEIFCIQTQGSPNLKELFNCINSLDLTIKLTMCYSATEINFLGVTVTNACNKLEKDLYYKPKDMHQHLHAQPCHHNVYKISIAWGQVVRFNL